jgi:hypothetical protein
MWRETMSTGSAAATAAARSDRQRRRCCSVLTALPNPHLDARPPRRPPQTDRLGPHKRASSRSARQRSAELSAALETSSARLHPTRRSERFLEPTSLVRLAPPPRPLEALPPHPARSKMPIHPIPRRVLCVAEKPSIAKEISRIMSSGQSQSVSRLPPFLGCVARSGRRSPHTSLPL